MDAATWIVAASGGSLLALLGWAVGAERMSALDALGLERTIGWEWTWCAYTPEKYQEIVERVAPPGDRVHLHHVVSMFYRRMGVVRDTWDHSPDLGAGSTGVTPTTVQWFNDLVRAVRMGSTAALSADERARLKSFLEAARAYVTIAAQAQERGDAASVSTTDLARVLCLSVERVEEVSRARLKDLADVVAIDLQNVLTAYGVRDVAGLTAAPRPTFGVLRVEDDDVATAIQEATAYEADLDELHAQIRRLDLRHVRPLVLRRDPASREGT